MKTFFIIVLIIISALMGGYFSNRLKLKCRFMRNIAYMLEEISMMIEYEAAEVGDIIKSLCCNERFAELDFFGVLNKEKIMDFSNSWEKAVCECNYNFLSYEEIELIKDIGRKLGKTDVAAQLNTIKYEKNVAERMLKKAESEYIAKGKLYRSLGVLCGAFIAVLFL